MIEYNAPFTDKTIQLAKSHGLNRIAQLLEANLKNRWGRTPLLCAIANFSTGYSASRSAPLSAAEKIKSVELLLEQGAQASINVADKAGVTPLLEAARQKNIELEVIRFLVENGAKPSINAPEIKDGRTPLWYDATVGSIELVKLLLDNGAKESLNQADSKGQTPLLTATSNNIIEVVRFLLQKGAASSVNVKGGQAFRTHLRCAVDKGNTELVKLLLEYGAAKSINEPDVYRFPPLESAALRGHKEIAWLLRTYREGTSASQ